MRADCIPSSQKLTRSRDSFVGGYVAEYLAQKQEQKWEIEVAIKYGCKASARVIEALGCLDPIAWADQVDIPRRPPQEADQSAFLD